MGQDNSTTAAAASLTGPPVSALVPPGQCQFKDEFVAVPLLQRTAVSATSSVLRFGLPDTKQPLNLSTCACILAQAIVDGEVVVRPYTPISTNDQVGSFDLLIKNYGPTAKMSRYMHQAKADGTDTSIAFKHIPFNVKIQASVFLAESGTDHILMIVGGTGITPMIQALHAILGQTTTGADANKKLPVVTVLYGSRVSDDILGKDLLDAWSKAHPEQLKVHHVLSHEPNDSKWTGLRGYITEALIAQHFPRPAKTDDANGNKKKLRIFVCGPPPMYDVLSGPRSEQDKVSGILGDMGYTSEQVYKF